jgi:uncharacterized protein (UPF0332 family)
MHQDLLDQAKHLAELDPRRPKQANLRRAVSTTYYAVFHFLVDQSCRAMIGTQQAQSPYRHLVARAFVHKNMNTASSHFSTGNLKPGVMIRLPQGFQLPAALQQLAATFVDLQVKRHDADYDLTKSFNRSDVLTAIIEAEDAIQQFSALPTSDEKMFYLACLWAYGSLPAN